MKAHIQIGILLFAIFFSSGCHTTKRASPEDRIAAKVAITKVMEMQEQAWSDGDIDAFMEGYWKSERLTFVGSKGITYGWHDNLARYKKGYPTRQAMGKLVFDIYALEREAADTYSMIGKYTLIKDEGRQEGYFSLIWKLKDGKWVIVSDHTS